MKIHLMPFPSFRVASFIKDRAVIKAGSMKNKRTILAEPRFRKVNSATEFL